MMEGSAIAAMAALRMQVEERLMQTEDYRVLKALDRAIADVGLPKGTARTAGEESPVAAQQGQLQQRLAEKYHSATA